MIAGIGVFLLMHRLLPSFGAPALLLASLGLTTLRWVVIAEFVDSLLPLLAAQVLHAASFGLYHAVAISLTNRFFTGNHRGCGQAIYSSLSFGAGLLWGAFGGAVAAAALAVAAIGLRDVND